VVDNVSRRVLDTACVGFATLAVGSWLLVAAADVGDAYRVHVVAGTWRSLAQRLGEGTL
jgi:hypothetical protein